MLPEAALAETLKKIEAATAARLQQHMTEIDRQHKAVLDVVFTTSKIFTSTLFQWLLPMLSTAGGFWLWNKVLAAPDVFQLTGLGLYGAFIMLPILYFTVRHRK